MSQAAESRREIAAPASSADSGSGCKAPAASRARGLSLHATDVDWAHRDGRPRITGKAAHLASALAGRPWALRELNGEGVAELRKRI